MDLQKLCKYIINNEVHDHNHIRKMGFGEIAQLVEDGAMNKELLLKLIDLSSASMEKNEQDEKAGKIIFEQCCDDKDMQKTVAQFYKSNR